MKIFLTLFSLSLVSSDPATDLNKCLEMGENMDLCLQITMSAFKKFMKTGVAEAGLPPLDPLVLDSVDFSLAGAKLTFSNLTAVGLSQHTAEQVEYERATRRLKLSLAIPRLATAGQYSLQGNILNVRGLDSNGPYRNEYSGVRVEGWAELVPGTEKGVSVGDMKLALNVERINVHLECLFPRPEQNCCEADTQFRSCNPIFAKTIHRTVNSKAGGHSFLDKFQGEITDRIVIIAKDYLNKALDKVEPKFFM